MRRTPAIALRFNLGSKSASNVHVQSYRGEEKALSALRRADDGRPMMQPGASYTFDMNLTSGGASGFPTTGTWTPRPIDLIEFDSVRWDGGTYDGNPPFRHEDNGRIYRYADVPAFLVKSFEVAHSKGQFFLSRIADRLKARKFTLRGHNYQQSLSGGNPRYEAGESEIARGPVATDRRP
jgi:hypothetical protein